MNILLSSVSLTDELKPASQQRLTLVPPPFYNHYIFFRSSLFTDVPEASPPLLLPSCLNSPVRRFRLFLTMRATRPTTRPAHSLYKLRACPFDSATPRLRFPGGLNPANPLIAREWRNILPRRPCRWGRSKDFSQIRRHFVHRSSGNFFFVHKRLPKCPTPECPPAPAPPPRGRKRPTGP